MLRRLLARAAEGDVYIADTDMIREEYGDYIQGACVLGETLYLYGDCHLFFYHMGDKEVTPIEYALPQAGEGEP